MDMSTLNWGAVLVAALSTFTIGWLWYSQMLFGKVMKRENMPTGEDNASHGVKVLVLSFLWTLVMSFNLAMFLNDNKTDISWGAVAGFLAGFGWVAMAIFIIGLFERKSTKYMLVHAGYMTVSFIIMGVIIGAWR